MQIEWIKESEKSLWWVLHVEGEPWKRFHRRIAGPYPKLPAAVTSKEVLEEVVQLYEFQQTKRFVFYCLSRRSYHSAELMQKLLDYGVKEAIIQQVMKECQALGYLDDEDWLKGFIRREIRQKKGPAYIKQKLQARGVNTEDLESLFTAPQVQQASLQALLKTKYAKKNLQDFKERQKVMAALYRKGFDSEQIRAAVAEMV